MGNTTISVPKQLRDRLRTFGFAGDTYADILQKMMDEIDRDRFVAEMKRRVARADAEESWVGHDDIDWGN